MNTTSKRSGINYDWLIWAFIVLCLVFRLYVIYFPMHLSRYLVPPGGDPISHLAIINQILNGNSNLSYPTLFHLIIIGISKFLALDPLRVMKWVTPAMVALPSIAVFLFLRKQFGKFAAIFGFVVILLSSNYALMAYADGNYPNILAAGFLLPIVLSYVISSSRGKKITNYIWVALLVIAIALTHHFTAAMLGVILIFYPFVLMLWNRKEKISPNLNKLVIFFVMVILLLVGVIMFTPVKELFVKVISQVIGKGGFVDDKAFVTPIEFSEYPAMVGSFVWYGGLISITYLFYLLGLAREKVNKSAILLILVWFAVMFALSRFSQVGIPGRFARETGIPLVLAMAVTLSHLISNYRARIQKIFAISFLGLIVSISLVQVNSGAYSSPNFFKPIVWFDQFDREKADYIREIVKPEEIILSNPATPYLPYFAQRNIMFAPLAPLNGDFETYLKMNHIRYIYIGNVTNSKPDPASYPFFKDFEEITNKMKEQVSLFDVAHKFSDGSVLYSFTFDNLKPIPQQ